MQGRHLTRSDITQRKHVHVQYKTHRLYNPRSFPPEKSPIPSLYPFSPLLSLLYHLSLSLSLHPLIFASSFSSSLHPFALFSPLRSVIFVFSLFRLSSSPLLSIYSPLLTIFLTLCLFRLSPSLYFPLFLSSFSPSNYSISQFSPLRFFIIPFCLFRLSIFSSSFFLSPLLSIPSLNFLPFVASFSPSVYSVSQFSPLRFVFLPFCLFVFPFAPFHRVRSIPLRLFCRLSCTPPPHSLPGWATICKIWLVID
ncbi:hypothetical protein JTE90_025199 [Oedothorax gibbosus]|uniref:Uncharacterized protein n=1 Tax=Oedothorax gibbosus TaxID=931172 RepID=A0AAV6UW23_9ARAC|nr:hypothetical protein JTE90_025199 [Oedothorax gibbosus]